MSVGNVENRLHWHSASVFASDCQIGLECVYAARGWIYALRLSILSYVQLGNYSECGYKIIQVVSDVRSVWSVSVNRNEYFSLCSHVYIGYLTDICNTPFPAYIFLRDFECYLLVPGSGVLRVFIRFEPSCRVFVKEN